MYNSPDGRHASAYSKGATRVDIEVGARPDHAAQTTLVHFHIDGSRVLEMAPTPELHEAIVDVRADICSLEDGLEHRRRRSDSAAGGIRSEAEQEWLETHAAR